MADLPRLDVMKREMLDVNPWQAPLQVAEVARDPSASRRRAVSVSMVQLSMQAPCKELLVDPTWL